MYLEGNEFAILELNLRFHIVFQSVHCSVTFNDKIACDSHKIKLITIRSYILSFIKLLHLKEDRIDFDVIYWMEFHFKE